MVSQKRDNGNALTPFELEIVKLTIDGFTTDQVAHKLRVSKSVVWKYRGTAIRKIEVKSFLHVILYAVREGLVEL